MRPTKNVKMMKKRKSVDAEGNEVEVVEEVVKDRPNWQTTEQWFHWDLAVWAWFGLAPCPDPQKEQDIHDGYRLLQNMRRVASRRVVSCCAISRASRIACRECCVCHVWALCFSTCEAPNAQVADVRCDEVHHREQRHGGL
jgi:hypothetical protein